MNETFRLGRIAGIPVGVNWSVLVVLWLLAWSLATGYLPAIEAGYRTGEYWAAGLLAAAVFMCSLLAHELAHSIVATRSGVKVEGITLWLFGGVSKLDSEATTPRTDFRIAVVGPAVSLGIAAVALLLAAGLRSLDAPALPVATLSWLGTINVILGLFNLIPAAPLDGGRVLRAVLWHRSGDHLGATLSAANAGRFFGGVLIALGVLEAFAGAGAGGLWLVFLGWFLLGAAKAEQTQAVLLEGLAGVRVRDIMSTHPIVVAGDLTVQAFLDGVVMQHHCSGFPVIGLDGLPSGLVTLARIKALPPAQRATTTVDQVAAPLAEVMQSTPEEPVVDLIRRLGASADGRALVFDETGLIGIVTPTDIVRMSEFAALRVGR